MRSTCGSIRAAAAAMSSSVTSLITSEATGVEHPSQGCSVGVGVVVESVAVVVVLVGAGCGVGAGS